jgi:hypothetical protein
MIINGLMIDLVQRKSFNVINHYRRNVNIDKAIKKYYRNSENYLKRFEEDNKYG